MEININSDNSLHSMQNIRKIRFSDLNSEDASSSAQKFLKYLMKIRLATSQREDLNVLGIELSNHLKFLEEKIRLRQISATNTISEVK